MNRRQATTLLEALIAIVVLLVALAALGTQATIGVRAAHRARLQSLSCQICEAMIAEQLASGTVRSVSARPANGFRDWMVQATVEPIRVRSLIQQEIDTSSAIQPSLLSVTAWQTGRHEQLSKLTLSHIVHPARRNERFGKDSAQLSDPEPRSPIGDVR